MASFSTLAKIFRQGIKPRPTKTLWNPE